MSFDLLIKNYKLMNGCMENNCKSEIQHIEKKRLQLLKSIDVLRQKVKDVDFQSRKDVAMIKKQNDVIYKKIDDIVEKFESSQDVQARNDCTSKHCQNELKNQFNGMHTDFTNKCKKSKKDCDLALFTKPRNTKTISGKYLTDFQRKERLSLKN